MGRKYSTFEKSESYVAKSDLAKAEEFNGQFTDVFNKYEHSQVPLLGRSTHFMDKSCFPKKEQIHVSED